MDKKNKNYLEYLQSAQESFSNEDRDLIAPYLNNPELFLPLVNQMDCVFFIMDYRKGKHSYVSPNSKSIQGYTADEIIAMDPAKALTYLEESDATALSNQMFPELLQILQSIHKDKDGQMHKIKFCVNLRLRQPDGSYRMIYQQNNILQSTENGHPLVLLGTISRMNDGYMPGKMILRVSEFCENNGWKIVEERSYKTTASANHPRLSEAEKKILLHIHSGKTSKETASELSISTETVNRHRKNIIKKFKAGNMIEALRIARDSGVI